MNGIYDTENMPDKPTHRLRNGSLVHDRRLDRIPQFDNRSKRYGIRQTIAATKPRSYTWSVNHWLDQGAEGACVGFAWAHELAARPKLVLGMTDQFARERIYWDAQRLDEWEGGSYPGSFPVYEGTSVLAGAKVCKALGYIPEYRWAFGLDDLRMAIGYRGPVVLGINWYEGMIDPDSSGRIRPMGDLVGGHAILANANDERNQRIWLHNSWGQEWGIKGRAWLHYDDILRLLHEQGEACIPSVRSL